MAQNRANAGICQVGWGLVLMALFAPCAGAAGSQSSGVGSQGFQREKGLEALARSDVRQVVFATRLGYDDSHWYANIGYYCDDEDHKAYAGNGKPDESGLYLLDAATGEVRALFDANGGGIRDPHVHYDGKTVLFSYRRSGSDYYHLYEIQVDGTGMRQVTQGPYDDYEAAYLPDDDIVFVSTRSKRWVGCWTTQVGTLFRCDRQGGNIRPLSFNLEHDNTPAVLPDGRILYTRWEYVDRSQVGYHQLWTMNPDGTGVTTFFGNQQHYPLFIAAKPIPGGDDLLLIDSPGHGRTDHRGHVCTITDRYGPDDPRGSRRITPKAAFNDPVPIDATSFLVVSNRQLFLGTYDGALTPVVTYKGNANVHEPVLVRPRPRERIPSDRTNAREGTGKMMLADVYAGRNMEGIRPGEIAKLLVLETLPKPVNFSGGMDLTSWLGTFTLERVLGTVPVEADGSAFFEVPAGRPVFFVALDANDLSVKRMQSFTNVMPGETLGCVGCHEPRTQAPGTARVAGILPARVEGVPPSNRGPEALATGGRDARDTEEARHTATVPKELADKDRLETYPAWSPDGKYLYYCSAPILWKDRDAVPPENYDKVKYDLRRIPYDVATNTWGESETVLSAAETGLSILLPRVSPDGRFLLFCMCRYGCFPVYQPSSDLYLMDLATRQYRKLAINSEFSESWHSWSGNSRWIAFSSKRQDGLFTRTYLSYVDEAGTVHKPFILPQRDPAHYDALLETYSMPELVKGPVRVSRARLARAARARPSVMPEIPITGASPKAPPVDPWQERE